MTTKMPMNVEVTIHSFSLWHHFAHKPGFDAFTFAELAQSMGFSGISLSLNDANYRHLGGKQSERMDRLREYLQSAGMSLEIDTSGTDPEHMREMLGVAARLGATSLRTYTRHQGSPAQMMDDTTHDLQRVMAAAEDAGIVVVLENHEDFTGPEMAQIIETVDHPCLKVLYDYGNSQMVLEDPEAALDAVLPYVYSVHVKDHVMVRAEHAGQLAIDGRPANSNCLTVAGVPLGEGFLPVTSLTKRLLDQGLRRLTFENVWAYAAPVATDRKPLGNVVLGEGAFRFLEPPFDPARLVLDQRQLEAGTLVELEYDALVRGSRYFFGVLQKL